MTQTQTTHRGGAHADTGRAPRRHAIGLDLGGTSIKAGLIDDVGKTVASATVPTPRTGGSQAVIDQLADVARRLIEQAGVDTGAIAGVGVGIPGAVDRGRGVVPVCVNLPGWKDVAVRDLLEAASGLPVVIENDANAAAFGEFAAMRASDSQVRHLVLITLGTGVGGGIVLDGQPLCGVAGEAGEIGHVLIDPTGPTCGCGQQGCLEMYASAPALIRRTRELDGHGAADATVAQVFSRAAAGDASAARAVDEAVDALAIACLNLCRLLDPPHIFLGGGVIEACPALADRVDAAVRAKAWKVGPHHTPITPARLGNRAGLLGAAALAFDFADDATRRAAE